MNTWCWSMCFILSLLTFVCVLFLALDVSHTFRLWFSMWVRLNHKKKRFHNRIESNTGKAANKLNKQQTRMYMNTSHTSVCFVHIAIIEQRNNNRTVLNEREKATEIIESPILKATFTSNNHFVSSLLNIDIIYGFCD